MKADQPLVDLWAERPPALDPLPATGGPLEPGGVFGRKQTKYHSDQCYCLSCADLRAAAEIYHKQKRLYEANGFI